MKKILSAAPYLILFALSLWQLSELDMRWRLAWAGIVGGVICYHVGNAIGFRHGLGVGEARWRDGRERWNGQDD